MSAWLELVAGDPALVRGLDDGRFELVGYDQHQLGRGTDAAISVRSPLLARRHAHLRWKDGGWLAVDNLSTNVTRVGGEALVEPRRLVPGDVLELPSGHGLAYREAGAAEQRAPDLEEALRAAPEDDHRFLVYADWLVERGEPLGRWMLESDAAGQGPWAASFVGALRFTTGRLEVRWRHGFIDQARVHCDGPEPRYLEPNATLRTLFEHPLARFLRVLALELDGFEGEPGPTHPLGPWERELPEVMQTLAERAPSTLRRVVVGPVPRIPTTPFIAPKLDAVRARCPQVEVVLRAELPHTLVLVVTHGDPRALQGFERGEVRLELDQLELGGGPQSALHVPTPDDPQPWLVLERLAGEVWLRPLGRQVMLDGVVVSRPTQLVPGQELVLPSGHRLHVQRG